MKKLSLLLIFSSTLLLAGCAFQPTQQSFYADIIDKATESGCVLVEVKASPKKVQLKCEEW